MNKEERVRAVQINRTERIAKQALSLTVAVLRAKILLECVQPTLDRLAVGSDTVDQLREEAFGATLHLKSTDGTTADSVYSVYCGCLYAVVEKWRDWKFSDESIDDLLSTGPVEQLKKFRHAVFHADHYDHSAITSLASRDGVLEWTRQLQSAFESFLRTWHEDPATHVRKHMARTES